MAALTSVNDIVAGLQPPQAFIKSTPGLTAGLWASFWTTSGFPTAGAASTVAGTLHNSTTPGALILPAVPAGWNSYLASMEVALPQGCMAWLVDRIVASAGLNGTVVGAQTVGTPAFDGRTPSAVGVMLALEIYSALGATSTTATVSYTNQAGTAGRSTTVTIPANAPAGRLIPVALQAGDTGVQSVQNVSLAATTGTVGSFGVTLYKFVAALSMPNGNIGSAKDFLALGAPVLGGGSTSLACLSFHLLPSSGTGGSLAGGYVVTNK
jgi:hypothetical protein